MKDTNIYCEDNGLLEERFTLVTDRLRQAAAQPETEEPYRDYFQKTAEFLLLTVDVLRIVR